MYLLTKFKWFDDDDDDDAMRNGHDNGGRMCHHLGHRGEEHRTKVQEEL